MGRSKECQTTKHEDCEDLVCTCWCHKDPDEIEGAALELGVDDEEDMDADDEG